MASAQLLLLLLQSAARRFHAVGRHQGSSAGGKYSVMQLTQEAANSRRNIPELVSCFKLSGG